jgi:hypothetical protein
LDLPLNHQYHPGTECSIDGCHKRRANGSLCSGHHARVKRGVEVNSPLRKMQAGVWGEWKVTSDGYIRRSRTVNGIAEYQHLHRLTMEDELGRPLLPSENVHHINGIRHDNRIENLELWVTSQPKGQRPSDLVEWAREILERYSDA